ncbi:hypothetical protein XJ44_00520 [Thermosipho affectus]|uniref:DNA-binding response regulator n=1 Tax=Thermosipho affectus TaxID=660294 RepID=A0ABX3ING0_9BACT|nr:MULTISPECIES: LytTR family DNA-binding domain-containing protein [Thermosipho]ANQ53033.1 LytTR family transcriptional regulator [Thermosipho sp. 1070]APT71480.1 LytTR family transcriptional regulator [Thermosipho sp. 1063]ONN28062.1 hypothetical protein XJ44_00520 [Thermosipho affectus]OOC45552.1 hypothetical protein XO08_00535 [Thermosipho sp. 1074]
MIKVSIVEDEFASREHLKKLILSINEFELIGEYQSIDEIKNLNNLDILFLDINLNGKNGLEFARFLKDIKVVFVTAYPEYGAEAFEINAIDYLVKPVTETRFKQCVDKILELFRPHFEKLPVIDQDGILLLDIEKILYIESFGKTATAITLEKEYKIHKLNIGTLEKKLPDSFLRVHKSFIVNMNKLKKITKERKNLLLKLGDSCEITIPVSKKYSKLVKRYLHLL